MDNMCNIGESSVREWNAYNRIDYAKTLKYRSDILNMVCPGGVGIELGVAGGDFSLEILQIHRLRHLYSVDMWAGDRGHDLRQYFIAIKKLSPFRDKSTIIKAKFEEAITLFPDEYFDFIYIDGYAHTGEMDGGTFYDWLPKLKCGGVMGGHDYSDEFPLVIKNVNKFISEKSLKLFVVNDTRSEGGNFSMPSWYTIKKIDG